MPPSTPVVMGGNTALLRLLAVPFPWPATTGLMPPLEPIPPVVCVVSLLLPEKFLPICTNIVQSLPHTMASTVVVKAMVDLPLMDSSPSPTPWTLSVSSQGIPLLTRSSSRPGTEKKLTSLTRLSPRTSTESSTRLPEASLSLQLTHRTCMTTSLLSSPTSSKLPSLTLSHPSLGQRLVPSLRSCWFTPTW